MAHKHWAGRLLIKPVRGLPSTLCRKAPALQSSTSQLQKKGEAPPPKSQTGAGNPAAAKKPPQQSSAKREPPQRCELKSHEAKFSALQQDTSLLTAVWDTFCCPSLRIFTCHAPCPFADPHVFTLFTWWYEPGISLQLSLQRRTAQAWREFPSSLFAHGFGVFFGRGAKLR